MTICIAALYRHAYGPNIPQDVRMGIVTASDRMWTMEALDIEYEPTQGKWSSLTKRIMILVADDISVHSDLIQQLRPWIETEKEPRIRDVADKYGELLRQLRAKRAAQYALSLYGLTTEQFIDKQRVMDQNVLTSFDSAMQQYESRIRAQALVVGFDPTNTAHIYHIDNDGISHCYDDIGFACIGIGRSHANSAFARRSYSNIATYNEALLITFAAKKSAEVAPGVGPQTDMHQIIESGTFTIHHRTRASLDKIYAKYEAKRIAMERDAVQEFARAELKNLQDEQKAGVSSSPARDATVLAGQQSPVPAAAPRGGRRVGTPLRLEKRIRTPKPSR